MTKTGKATTKKVVVLRFRNSFAQQTTKTNTVPGNRFADVDQILDRIFDDNRLECA